MPGPPAIAIDRSACSRCGMLISERAHAAAIRWADGRDDLFDDIGCLVAAAHEHAATGVRYWFHDVTSGEWISDASPVFVTSPSLRTPMGGGIVAFRDRPGAERFAASHAGRVVTDVASLPARNGSNR
jgi:nitrous oxide reductase accessory protein NosL